MTFTCLAKRKKEKGKERKEEREEGEQSAFALVLIDRVDIVARMTLTESQLPNQTQFFPRRQQVDNSQKLKFVICFYEAMKSWNKSRIRASSRWLVLRSFESVWNYALSKKVIGSKREELFSLILYSLTNCSKGSRIRIRIIIKLSVRRLKLFNCWNILKRPRF